VASGPLSYAGTRNVPRCRGGSSNRPYKAQLVTGGGDSNLPYSAGLLSGGLQEPPL